jgi:hypothetical protein
MEQLCLQSFLYHGHSFHLYVYEQPTGVPDGVELMDAELILPQNPVINW